jgi:hypothetical protein
VRAGSRCTSRPAGRFFLRPTARAHCAPLQAARGDLAAQLLERASGLSEGLEAQRAATRAYAAHCDGAHRRCDELRRAVVVLEGKADAACGALRQQVDAAAAR